MENKKAKAKSYYQNNKVNCKEDRERIIEIFPWITELKNEIMLTWEVEICQMKIRKEKYEYMINCCYKWENVLNRFINRNEELEIVRLNK